MSKKSKPYDFSTAEDFVEFTIDGKPFRVDLDAALAALEAVDLRHEDDAWRCQGCQRDGLPKPPIERRIDPICPECGAGDGRYYRDPVWLESVARWVTSLGAPQCSTRVAAQIYSAICDTATDLKKNMTPTPESRSISASTQPDGAEAANGFI